MRAQGPGAAAHGPGSGSACLAALPGRRKRASPSWLAGRPGARWRARSGPSGRAVSGPGIRERAAGHLLLTARPTDAQPAVVRLAAPVRWRPARKPGTHQQRPARVCPGPGRSEPGVSLSGSFRRTTYSSTGAAGGHNFHLARKRDAFPSLGRDQPHRTGEKNPATPGGSYRPCSRPGPAVFAAGAGCVRGRGRLCSRPGRLCPRPGTRPCFRPGPALFPAGTGSVAGAAVARWRPLAVLGPAARRARVAGRDRPRRAGRCARRGAGRLGSGAERDREPHRPADRQQAGRADPEHGPRPGVLIRLPGGPGRAGRSRAAAGGPCSAAGRPGPP